MVDSRGGIVQTLIDSEKEAGEHFIDTDVSEFTPGIYIYKITAGLLSDSKKLVVKR
jgi:hypothetical protein